MNNDIVTVLKYLFRSEFLFSFLGFFRMFELEYTFWELLLSFMVDSCSVCSVIADSMCFMLMLRFVMDSCFVITGSMYYMLLLLRFGDVLWNAFAEPVRFICAFNVA